MRYKALLLLISLGIIISSQISSCSKGTEPDRTENTTPTQLSYEELAHFDTSKYFIILGGLYPENYIDGDYNMGEPFTDVNGNGIYDQGVDIFIMSADPDINQDLSHDGRYNGPDHPWSPGIPYDDLNHNGTFDRKNQEYDVGELFADANSNGVRDGYSYPGCAGWVTKCQVDRPLPDSIVFSYHYRDSCWSYISDSGKTYIIPERSIEWWDYDSNDYRSIPNIRLSATTRGLISHGGPRLEAVVLDTGYVTASQERISVLWNHYFSDSATMVRSIIIDTTVDICGTTKDSVIVVRLDQLLGSNELAYPGFETYWWEYYFTRHEGFIGIATESQQPGNVSYAYIFRQVDTIPLELYQ